MTDLLQVLELTQHLSQEEREVLIYLLRNRENIKDDKLVVEMAKDIVATVKRCMEEAD